MSTIYRKQFVLAVSCLWVAIALTACSGERRVPARPLLLTVSSEASDLAPVIAAEHKKAQAQQATLLVYVGAKWCEPCRHFHDALKAGELDASLPDLRFLEFDYDRSRDALQRAGYVSTLIPLFAFPNPDGTASERRMEGSVKGPDAVAQNLLPRLKALLAADP